MSQANSGASSQDSNSQAASNQAGLSSGTWEIDNIKQDIIKANKELKKRRNYFLWVGGFITFFLGLGVLGNFSSSTDSSSRTQSLILGVALIIVVDGIILFFMQLQKYRDQGKIDSLETQKSTLEKLAGISEITGEKTTYFDRLVELNITNLDTYYALAKDQAEKSFLASLGVGFVGFFLISFGLVIGVTKISSTLTITYISTGSGVITEFIAGVFFYLYNKTVIQMKGYHDKLVELQDTLLSLKIVEEIKQEDDRNEKIGQILPYLLTNVSSV
jgi:hypothetical protein